MITVQNNEDRTFEADAYEIRMRAQRKLGQMIEKQKATVGLNTGGRPRKETGKKPASAKTGGENPPVLTPTLAEVGITKEDSREAREIAAVPEAQFEAELADKRERAKSDSSRVSKKLTSIGAKVIAERDPKAVDPADAIPSDEELAAAVADDEDQQAAIQVILHADDKLAAATAEVARLNAVVKLLKLHLNGVMNAARDARVVGKRAETRDRKPMASSSVVSAMSALPHPGSN